MRSALTAALAVRLVPVLGRDARRLADARRCRPDAGPRPNAAERLQIVRAVATGALDRALDVAATLEVRGYATPAAAGGAPAACRTRGRATTSPSRPRRSRSSRSRPARGCSASRTSTPTRETVIRTGASEWSSRPPSSLVALLPFADRRGIA